MRRPQGYGVWTGPTGVTERDSITCGHCQRVVFVKPGTVVPTYLIYSMDPTAPPKEEAGAHCRVCDRAVCLRCHADGRCTPFEQRIEQMEARARFARQVCGV